VFAPGRVNLIGEHTDYNEGFVLPLATEMGITMEAVLRSDELIRLKAVDLGKEFSLSLSELNPGDGKQWWNYPAGVFWAFLEEGYQVKGADLVFSGDIPIGSGLSSSAALEVATAAAIAKLNRLEVDAIKLALLSQKAENRYVGVQCGIMDQFASALAISGHAVFIDCRSLDHEHIPLNLSGQVLAIIDSRVKRSLSGTEYNRRREECREALNLINQKMGQKKSSLRDVSCIEIENARSFLPDVLYRRSRFVVEENQRVIETVKAFQSGDLSKVGQLMIDSHTGLSDLYEVSCRELDLLAETAWSTPGVWGARMTGAGFGGCVIALVERTEFPKLKSRILESAVDGLEQAPHFYVTEPAAGCRVKVLE